jgi:Ni,Fe-hydrogenase III small subunit
MPDILGAIAVPEPSTILLIGASITGFVFHSSLAKAWVHKHCGPVRVSVGGCELCLFTPPCVRPGRISPDT